MTVKQFVDEELCVPVTRVGNKFIAEAIELVLDRRDHKFYEELSEITHKKQSYLETAIRTAKVIGLSNMRINLRTELFGNYLTQGIPTNMEYILKATEYYRRKYENKES